jgi:hypothetical protein
MIMVKALVIAVLNMVQVGHLSQPSEKVSSLRREIEGLPQSLEGMRTYIQHRDIGVSPTSVEFVCCPRCWALYHSGTMKPESHPDDGGFSLFLSFYSLFHYNTILVFI